jgi:hypothetical protein
MNLFVNRDHRMKSGANHIRRERLRGEFRPAKSYPGGLSWIDPLIVGRIEFLEWTPENRLRHPHLIANGSNVCLRPD